MGPNTSVEKIPVVYKDDYNIKFLGIEKAHPFDSSKFGKIAKALVEAGVVKSMSSFYVPKKITDSELRKYHTKEYMDRVSTTDGLLAALEFNLRYHVESEMKDGWIKSIAKFVINRETIMKYAIDSIIGSALRYQVGGTILAGELALLHGFAINIGGGMHHASSNDGGGWCVFGDIQMSIVNLMNKYDGKEGTRRIENAMIVDFDVHRGNGHAIDKGNKRYGRANVFIVDIYDKGNYPAQKAGLDQIDVGRGLTKVGDEEYLANVFEVLLEAFEKFKPDVVFYNAGSDILDSDPLGGFQVSERGMMERDRLVFEFCLNREIPIVMMTSGGYAKENAEAVGKSMIGVLKYIKKFYEDKEKEIKGNKKKKKKKKNEEEEEEEEEVEGEEEEIIQGEKNVIDMN